MIYLDKVTHRIERYCDVCGKLIYAKDYYTKVALPVDYYEIEYSHQDNPLNQNSKRYKSVCSQKCLLEKAIPLYFMRVNAKIGTLENSEELTITHKAYE